MATQPFLSVVMPVHDGAEWVATTLDSVAAGPVDGIEIIVLDSSPTDDTAAIVDRYLTGLTIRLLRRPDLGPWQVKTNLGVELAAADYACILHQDDLWLPGRVPAVRKWVSDARGAVLHLAPTLVIDRHGRRLGRWRCPLPAERPLEPGFLLQRLVVQNFVAVPAAVFRRSAWLECGGMDEQLWYTPDWDMWAKLSGSGPVVYHDEMTTAFRVHGSSLTVTGSRAPREFRDQMETVLERHLGRIPARSRRAIEHAARTSIDVNVRLAAASAGNVGALFGAAAKVLALGPAGMRRYLRDSRIAERILPRVRARMTGAF